MGTNSLQWSIFVAAGQSQLEMSIENQCTNQFKLERLKKCMCFDPHAKEVRMEVENITQRKYTHNNLKITDYQLTYIYDCFLVSSSIMILLLVHFKTWFCVTVLMIWPTNVETRCPRFKSIRPEINFRFPAWHETKHLFLEGWKGAQQALLEN